ncbi:carboxypeptidase regulatory-like domain-containing protein [Methanosarcina mazei]|uniref:PEGA domain-containing protein n=3 Tax=Methanosarcina mazei TaxID=2209 RepID=A0A0F8JFK6_METMZ|nr:carboxypeptidase regulatory-like domain-containing protein [Methanosarcina mazei]AKB41346.1 hypothetical protein MSMAW_2355 [Methanosarcina mazei WWM610]AKB70959.1 hypothetical protein MSMAC_1069 [Methanosarcina mazei C16]KKG00632.1 hypothetical protein DU40_10130 [Methanosarcina mazei]KKG36702.1 hypothetical protein DU30_17255 [Methanosarcina mazei]KKG37111.1 hypothetical protein DU52_11340 [Methanosarcina mazei]
MLLLCLLAIPASAWEQSFENHPGDEPQNVFSGGNIHNYGHGYIYRMYTPNSIEIKKPFDGYLGFTLIPEGTGSGKSGRAYIHLVNSDGIEYFNLRIGGIFNELTSPKYRVEVIEESSGQGVTIYVDGVERGSASYIAEKGTPEKIIIEGTRNDYVEVYLGIDDISNNYGMVGCDNDFVSETDDYQYYTVGYPKPDLAYMFTKIYDPNNNVIATQNISNYSELSIEKSMIVDPGTYSIKLFMHDNLSGNNYYFAQRNFIFNKPSGKSIILDKEEYAPGDQVQIFTYMPSYSSGHKVTVNYKTSSGYTSYTYDVTSAEQNKNWVLPSNAQGGSFFAYFRDSSDNVVAYDSFEIIAPLGTMSLTLDKSTYEKNDTVRITYKYLPEDSDITLILRSGTTNVYTESWRDLSGSGVITFNINGRAADSIYVKAVSGSNILKEATAKILSGEGFVSGKVYDSTTATPISGATISIGGSQTTTDVVGYYELSVPLGTQPVTITKDGYQQYTGNMQVYSFAFSKLFYLVPIVESDSNTLYGTIEDYYTGEPLTGTYIQIKNGSTVYTMLTHSRTGNYLFDQEGLEGTWTLTVTKTGYDTYTRKVTLEGDTYLSIKLVPVGGSPNIPDDGGSGGSGGTGGTESTDRPSREAAKESLTWLESVMPNLIKLVVVVFVLALIGWRF